MFLKIQKSNRSNTEFNTKIQTESNNIELFLSSYFKIRSKNIIHTSRNRFRMFLSEITLTSEITIPVLIPIVLIDDLKIQ